MKRPSHVFLTLAAFLAAGLLSVAAAIWGVGLIEQRSAASVRDALLAAGLPWAGVGTDGLQVVLTGTAPTESARIRAISAAGAAVDPGRVVDAMNVTGGTQVAPPEFLVEILRNGDGISLIGLVPADTDRARIVGRLADLAGAGRVADLLDTASQPVPEAWAPALDFALAAIETLPRARISVAAGRVSVTAISDSAAERSRIESGLRRRAPAGLALTLDISAPRPVIAPFTLRFLLDAQGARFDACSADSEDGRDRIVAAAQASGAGDGLSCTIGLGVPSPSWTDAVVMGMRAVATLGEGTLTFTDADITLVVPAGVGQALFDSAVGQFESNLPEVFSLKVVRAGPEAAGAADAGVPEFTATRAGDGRVTLSGRIPDARTRDAVDSFARTLFGKASVAPAMRIDASLPPGWPVRVLAAVEALDAVAAGSVTVSPDAIRIEGTSGARDASDRVARTLAGRLGGDARIGISIRYDAGLDPLNSQPGPEVCARDLNALLAAQKITFEPGKAVIAPEAKATLDRIAGVMKRCSDYPMEVAGHTDSQGREEMNLALSQTRAEAVVQALMDRRILTGNLTARGYGETVPVADNGTEAGRESNRRIEFRLIRPEDRSAQAAGITVLRPTAETRRPRPRPARGGADGVATGGASGNAGGGSAPAD